VPAAAPSPRDQPKRGPGRHFFQRLFKPAEEFLGLSPPCEMQETREFPETPQPSSSDPPRISAIGSRKNRGKRSDETSMTRLDVISYAALSRIGSTRTTHRNIAFSRPILRSIFANQDSLAQIVRRDTIILSYREDCSPRRSIGIISRICH